MRANWNYPTTIWVGENRIQDLGLACKNLKIDKPLFVTDKDLINLKMVQDIILDLKKTFNHLQVFSNFSGNPVGENVEEGVGEFKKLGCDGVIAFGGGSGLDVGKAIALCQDSLDQSGILKILVIIGKELMKLTLHLSLLYPLQQGQDQKLEEHQL